MNVKFNVEFKQLLIQINRCIENILE